MADAHASGACTARCGGSSPLSGTAFLKIYNGIDTSQYLPRLFSLYNTPIKEVTVEIIAALIGFLYKLCYRPYYPFIFAIYCNKKRCCKDFWIKRCLAKQCLARHPHFLQRIPLYPLLSLYCICMRSLSPWLYELHRTRPVIEQSGNITTDIVVVGGGISGAATAYYLLTSTPQSVVLVEGDTVASGATGNNGGQIVDYFERPIDELFDAFDFHSVKNGIMAIKHSWDLLTEIFQTTKLPFSPLIFDGYAGISNILDVKERLHELFKLKEAGIPIRKMLIAKELLEEHPIEDVYRELYEIVDREFIKDVLNTKDSRYQAVLQEKKGCMNSALFTEQLVTWLLWKFPHRFYVYERTPVKQVHLSATKAYLQTVGGVIECNQVVLCTNGFEQLTIKNYLGANIDQAFHDSVYSIVGYMAAYLEKGNKPPAAVSFLERDTNTYFYVTRRPFFYNQKTGNLIAIGGPDTVYKHDIIYVPGTSYPKEAKKRISSFLKKTWRGAPEHEEYIFTWQGLMGYTKTGVRKVGPEPLNTLLYYNVGCNGVGLLPAIWGGYRIACYFAKKHMPKTMFDTVQ